MTPIVIKPGRRPRTALQERAVLRNEHDLARSAIIFAPHPDDETLGCGGTVILKRQLGAKVKIVVMTDGSRSHTYALPPDEMRVVRHSELIAAASNLGIQQDDIRFLDFQDGFLHLAFESAVECVLAVLDAEQPEEVYIPYRYDHHHDHIATNRVVRAALKRLNRPITVLEYPIWFWYHWPWISLVFSWQLATLTVLRHSFAAGLGLRALTTFRSAVEITSVLEQKRNALDQHRSQMTRYLPQSEWHTLRQVSAHESEFINCFFEGYEYFHQYQIEVHTSKLEVVTNA